MIRTSAIISDGTYPCATAILQGNSREVFARAKAAGYDCVQLTIHDTEDYDEDELRILMEEYGLGISAMATGRVYTVDGLSMASSDEDNRRRCVERLCRLADMSSRLPRPASVDRAVAGRAAPGHEPIDGKAAGDILEGCALAGNEPINGKAAGDILEDCTLAGNEPIDGKAAGDILEDCATAGDEPLVAEWLDHGIASIYRCPAIVVGAVRGLFADARSREEYYRQFDRSIRELAEYCEPLNVPVILEADDHLEADAYLKPSEVLRYVEEVNMPSLWMYLDVMHMYNEGLDPAEQIRRYAAHSYSIDISGENRVAPMDSKLDFAAIARAIKDSGFSGYLNFEMPPAPPQDNAEKSLAYIRRLLGGPGD